MSEATKIPLGSDSKSLQTNIYNSPTNMSYLPSAPELNTAHVSPPSATISHSVSSSLNTPLLQKDPPITQQPNWASRVPVDNMAPSTMSNVMSHKDSPDPLYFNQHPVKVPHDPPPPYSTQSNGYQPLSVAYNDRAIPNTGDVRSVQNIRYDQPQQQYPSNNAQETAEFCMCCCAMCELCVDLCQILLICAECCKD